MILTTLVIAGLAMALIAFCDSATPATTTASVPAACVIEYELAACRPAIAATRSPCEVDAMIHRQLTVPGSGIGGEQVWIRLAATAVDENWERGCASRHSRDGPNSAQVLFNETWIFNVAARHEGGRSGPTWKKALRS